MSRLKGGRVLIDLSAYNITEDIVYNCNDEEFKAILDKGVSVNILNNGVSCCIDLIPRKMSYEYFNYQNLIFYYESSEHEFLVSLNIISKVLSFTEI